MRVPVQALVGVGVGANKARESEGGVVTGVDTVGVDMANVQLNGSMILGTDDSVSGGAVKRQRNGMGIRSEIAVILAGDLLITNSFSPKAERLLAARTLCMLSRYIPPAPSLCIHPHSLRSTYPPTPFMLVRVVL